jgi:hypothetical protein
MATATTFKPNTDTFGQLTLHATILGEQTFGNLSTETRRSHVNLLIAMVFLITLVVGGIGLYRLDQATFGQPHNQIAATRALTVDYD